MKKQYKEQLSTLLNGCCWNKHYSLLLNGSCPRIFPHPRKGSAGGPPSSATRSCNNALLLPTSLLIALTIILLSLIGIYTIAPNTSALTYSNNTDVSFTFNPTISISLSSADLIIEDLVPGSASDSNIITVTTSTNNVAGHILSASVGDGTTYTNTNLVNTTNANSASNNSTNSTNSGSNSNNSNNTYFTSLATDADISWLNNINAGYWGYAYSSDSGTTWSNYSGLPYYNTTPKELASTDTHGTSSLEFKIGASADNWQIAGEYNNVINFYAVTKIPPVSISDAYASAGKTRYKGYYKMQDMSPAILSAVQATGENSTTPLIDTRDNNVYFVTKLADGNIWMTQNLDLILSPSTELNSDNTNLTAYQDDDGNTFAGYRYDNGIIYWTPNNTLATPATITGTPVAGNNANMISGWVSSNAIPYQAEGGDRYNYTSNSSEHDIIYTSLAECKAGVISAGKASSEAEAEGLCKHYHLGNYYNFTASIAMNDSSSISDWHEVAPNSICPAGWRLPKGLQNPENPDQPATVASEYNQMLYANKITNQLLLTDGIDSAGPDAGYASSGFTLIRSAPVWLVRSGYVSSSTLVSFARDGIYWSNTAVSGSLAYFLEYFSSQLRPTHRSARRFGTTLRCLADN